MTSLILNIVLGIIGITITIFGSIAKQNADKDTLIIKTNKDIDDNNTSAIIDDFKRV